MTDAAGRRAGSTLWLMYEGLLSDLESYLRENFNVTVRSAPLSGLRGFLVSAPSPGEKRGLVVSDAISHAERLYLYIHIVAHILLEAGRSHRTIWEPRPQERPPGTTPPSRESDEDGANHRDADLLARAILWGGASHEWLTLLSERQTKRSCPPTVWVEPLEKLLPGHRHRALRRALDLGLTRSVILNGLRLVRGAYGLPGVRRAFGNHGLTREFRELLCLTEVVNAVPELARAA